MKIIDYRIVQPRLVLWNYFTISTTRRALPQFSVEKKNFQHDMFMVKRIAHPERSVYGDQCGRTNCASRAISVDETNRHFWVL